MPENRIGRRPWDLLVVGAGTAGLIGAQVAAGLGARVLLAERARFGGDCLWTGCVPSKALLAAAHAAADARAAARYGVHVGEVTIDGAAVLAHVRGAISTIEPVDSPDAVRTAGAHPVSGDVRFTGPTSAEIDGRPVRFRSALIASGSAPALPDLPGMAAVDPLTTDTVWELTALPDRMAVLGGGSSGCELAQALARLGVQITLVEGEERLLPHEDPDASAAVTAALRTDGVDVRTGTSVTRVDAGRLHLADGATVPFDRLLVAVGRTPRTAGLDLTAVGAVGESTAAPGPDRRTVTRSLRTADRAITEASTDGFSRLVVDGGHRIRGATLVGPRAGESLSELTLAVTRRLRTSDLVSSIHPYPTYADPQWNASIRDAQGRLAARPARAALTFLRLARRAVLALS